MRTHWHPEMSYSSLPLSPEAARLEARMVLKATAMAREALGRLDMADEKIPNPTVLILN